MVDAVQDENKDTAQSHTPSTPSLSAALQDALDSDDANKPKDPADDATAAPPADDAGLDLSLLKKKKKKKKVEGEDAGEETPAGEDGGLDLTLKKKKKKKVKETGDAADDEFTAKLKQLEVEGGDNAEPEKEEVEDTGDMDTGTGIWSHDETKSVPYNLLLQRFFHQLALKNPDHALSGTKSYKIPPPQCMREGNKKTVFANIADICKKMKRTEEHVTAYLFAELGTNGSVDGNRRLVIKGRFQQKQIENVVRKYISKFCSHDNISVTGIENTNTWDPLQSNTSLARPASLQTQNSARVRTVFTSSPATTAVLDDQSRPSRQVSQPKSERERRCRVKSKKVCTKRH